MTSCERNYAQIEKETLVIVFGTEKFHEYLYGKKFVIETDHKPLQPIFAKSITKASPRIQRFLLRLQRYDSDAEFTPGKYLFIADALSRAYLSDIPKSEIPEIEYHVHFVISNLPISRSKFQNSLSVVFVNNIAIINRKSLLYHMTYPWEKVGYDVFHCLGQNYLLLVDYYSNFPEVCLRKGTHSSTVITHMKSIFARYGIPKTIVSDSGPQCSSFQFQ